MTCYHVSARCFGARSPNVTPAGVSQSVPPESQFAADFRSSSGFPGTVALASDPTKRLADTFGADQCAPSDITLGRDKNGELTGYSLCRYDYAPHMTMVPATERFSFNYMGLLFF